MPLDPTTYRCPGHVSQVDGTTYGPVGADRRLAGLGRPPADPAFQARYPGAGRLIMEQRIVTVADIDEQHRPPESDWVEIPA